MEKITEALEAQGVSANLLKEIAAFRAHYPVEEALQNRVTAPDMPYYGRETFEMAAYALLQGENILLTGSKATGKKYSGGKSCVGVRQTVLQHVLSCQHGQQRACGRRYISRR